MCACATCTYDNLLVPCTCVRHVLFWNANFLNCINLWGKRSHPLVAYSETVGISFRSSKNYLSVFKFSPASAVFCKTFPKDFRWSIKYLFVMTNALSISACNGSKPLKSSYIFLEIYPGCYIHPYKVFGTYTPPPHGSTIAQRCFAL